VGEREGEAVRRGSQSDGMRCDVRGSARAHKNSSRSNAHEDAVHARRRGARREERRARSNTRDGRSEVRRAGVGGRLGAHVKLKGVTSPMTSVLHASEEDVALEAEARRR
jgi:hypothetical protein